MKGYDTDYDQQQKSIKRIHQSRSNFAGGGKNLFKMLKSIFVPSIWKFEKKMRVLEYYHNCRKDIIGRMIYQIKRISYERYSAKLGFSIPINVFGPGLCIGHIGTIVINGNTKIGANARIHIGVNIGNYSKLGSDWRSDNTPTIGDNVYIGPGAKLFGKITIGNDVAIGANAVVNKDVPDHVTVAGVPAKIINDRGSEGMIIKGAVINGE